MAVDLVSARVTANAQVRSGQRAIRGTRITVWDIFGWLGGGLPESDILIDYPELAAEDIQAALQFAYQLKDKSYPVKASTASPSKPAPASSYAAAGKSKILSSPQGLVFPQP
ncbi:MAG: DUF433 domain-containing protein [Acidobacteriota bacterium]|nr:DUF433 domain-containing protein [Acidobacteriota bacterium]